jgi:hypothetical protein
LDGAQLALLVPVVDSTFLREVQVPSLKIEDQKRSPAP